MFGINISEDLKKVIENLEILKDFYTEIGYQEEPKEPPYSDEESALDSLIEIIQKYRDKEISSDELLASLTSTQQIVKNTEAMRKNSEKIYKELTHNFITLKMYLDFIRFKMVKDPELKSECLEIHKLIDSDSVIGVENQFNEVCETLLTEKEVKINETIKKYLSNYSKQFYVNHPYLFIKKMIPLIDKWIKKQEELDDIDRHAIVTSRKLTELLSILTFVNPL